MPGPQSALFAPGSCAALIGVRNGTQPALFAYRTCTAMDQFKACHLPNLPEQLAYRSRRVYRICRLIEADPRTVRQRATTGRPEVRQLLQDLAGDRQRFGYDHPGTPLIWDGMTINREKLLRLNRGGRLTAHLVSAVAMQGRLGPPRPNACRIYCQFPGRPTSKRS
jgi:hypothetical protein